MNYEERKERIERCQRFIEIEGTEWGEFYEPILIAAQRGNGGGFDEDAEVLVRLTERGIDWMVEDGHYTDFYAEFGGPEREAEWRKYREQNPPLPVIA